MSKEYYVGDRLFSIKILTKEELEKERKSIEVWNQRHPDSQREAKAISITEECDCSFGQAYTKQEAIELFEDILQWIKDNAFDEDS